MGKIKQPEVKKKGAAPKKLPPASTAKPKQLPPPADDKTKALTVKANMADLLLEDQGSGMENMGATDFAIPRISILQKMSPQVEKTDPAFIPGAEVGMILDSVTGDLYDGQEGILVVLISYRFTHLNWWPRLSKKGKGFINDFGADPAVMQLTERDDKNRNIVKKQLPGLNPPIDSEIVPTAEYFAFIVDPDDNNHITRVLIPMARTQLKKSKKINTLSQILVPVQGRKIPAPLFYRMYRLTSAPETYGENTIMGWVIEPAQCLIDNELGLEVLSGGDDIYQEARAFKNKIQRGEVKVQKPGETESDHADGGGANRKRQDDNAPM